MLKRFNAKEVILPKSSENCKFSVADGIVQPYGGDQGLRTSTLMRNPPVRGESRQGFLDESEGSPPTTYFQDSHLDAGDARDDFWSISGDFIFRHHVEPKVKLDTPKEESFPIPLKYMDVTRVTHTTLDVLQESRIDEYWNIDGSRDLSDSWTGFTQVTLLKEEPPEGYMWSGERLTKLQATSIPDHFVARNLEKYVKEFQNGRETKLGQ